MSDEDYHRLLHLAGKGTVSDLLRRALNTEAYLTAAEKRGCKIIIAKSNGEEVELVRH